MERLTSRVTSVALPTSCGTMTSTEFRCGSTRSTIRGRQPQAVHRTRPLKGTKSGRSKVHRPLKGTQSGHSKVQSQATQRYIVRLLKGTQSGRSKIQSQSDQLYFYVLVIFFYFFKIQRNTLIEFPLKVILFQSVYMPFVCLSTYTFISACSRTCKRRTCS